MGNRTSADPELYAHWNLAFKDESSFNGELVSVSVLVNQEPAIKFQDAVANYVLAKAGDNIQVVAKAITETPLYVRLDAMHKSTGSGGYLLKVCTNFWISECFDGFGCPLNSIAPECFSGFRRF